MPNSDDLTKKIITHIGRLLNEQEIETLPAELAAIENMPELYAQLLKLRAHLSKFAQGEMSESICEYSFVADCLKSAQSHLLHLLWQIEQVEKGDFSVRIEHMNDFSRAFNKMVARLEDTLGSMRQNEDSLLDLNQALKKEVRMRNAAVQALRQSEAEFKYLAEHDPLTNVYNRRSFMKLAINELNAAKESGYTCCLAIMDVDHFKRFNDLHGHLAGDEALKHVVRLCSSSLRKADIMGRYGGEEFIFIFSNTTQEHGRNAAERVRNTIARLPMTKEDGQQIPLTVSIGVAWIECGRQEKFDYAYLQNFINLADAALYQAKKD